MGTNARIEHGYVSIDTAAWLEQRTAGPLDHLTRDLHAWAATTPRESSADVAAPLGLCWWQDAVLRWCAERRHIGPDPTDPDAGPTVINHLGTRLDADLWVARAVTAADGAIAVVRCNDLAPVVYSDAVTDSAYWYDADTVDLACPAGHGWTWRTGRELLTADGRFTTLTGVFGPNLDAPFTPCAVCTAHQLGHRAEPCGCDGSSWICCPTCGRRCEVHLPTR